MNEQTQAAKIEQNRVLGRRFFEAQDHLKGGPDPALCTNGYRARIGGNPPVDRAGHEGFARAFYEAFPDLRHETELVVADADHAVVRAWLQGTQRGGFLGIPATRRAIAVVMHVFLKIENGQVSELYGVFDEAGLLRQLGVLAR